MALLTQVISVKVRLQDKVLSNGLMDKSIVAPSSRERCTVWASSSTIPVLPNSKMPTTKVSSTSTLEKEVASLQKRMVMFIKVFSRTINLMVQQKYSSRMEITMLEKSLKEL